ncbi:MAG: isoprenylcysteine carboxylmethyltransferase family protein [Candidatus Omnitrophica bacterium]|nr:isoprenylcysteine carboxylmethyltransferase family protein [Candidatus Omnitrophota bacterium]
MSFKNRFKRWFKLRFAIIYPFGIFVVLSSYPDDKSIMNGIWFILIGLFLRSWANGYAIKLEKLTTSGPYAFVRHPLYLGTILLVLGFIIMLKIYYLGTLFFLIIIGVYYRTIKKEEQMLEQKFKHRYIDYKNKIPAIVPAVSPYREGEKWSFSLKRLIKSQEYKLFLWMIILVIAFHLKEEFLVEHEKIDTKIIVLIVTAFFLGIIDFIGEIIRWKKNET